jgi:hypothetical protein
LSALELNQIARMAKMIQRGNSTTNQPANGNPERASFAIEQISDFANTSSLRKFKFTHKSVGVTVTTRLLN